MDTLNNILRLLKLHKKTQKELCEFLGINGQAFTNWKNGNSESYKKYLPKIAEYFGITVDELMGKDEPAQEIPMDGAFRAGKSRFTHSLGVMNLAGEIAEEAEVVELFNKLTANDKKTVLDLMRRLSNT